MFKRRSLCINGNIQKASLWSETRLNQPFINSRFCAAQSHRSAAILWFSLIRRIKITRKFGSSHNNLRQRCLVPYHAKRITPLESLADETHRIEFGCFLSKSRSFFENHFFGINLLNQKSKTVLIHKIPPKMMNVEMKKYSGLWLFWKRADQSNKALTRC